MAPTPSRTPKETAAKKGIEVRLNDRNARADDALALLAAFSLRSFANHSAVPLRLVPCLSGLRLLQSPPTLEVSRANLSRSLINKRMSAMSWNAPIAEVEETVA
jgi:hypothetical protein